MKVLLILLLKINMPNKGSKRISEEKKEAIYKFWRETGASVKVISEEFDVVVSAASKILTKMIKQKNEEKLKEQNGEGKIK